jgi:hypothetical protein
MKIYTPIKDKILSRFRQKLKQVSKTELKKFDRMHGVDQVKLYLDFAQHAFLRQDKMEYVERLPHLFFEEAAFDNKINVYFPENKDILEALKNVRYNVTTDFWNFPVNDLIIKFPEDYGDVVSVFLSISTSEEMIDFARRRYGFGFFGSEEKNMLKDERLKEKYVTFHLDHKDRAKDIYYTFTKEDVVNIMADRESLVAVDNLNSVQNFKEIFRLCLALGIYMKVFPDAVSSGYPKFNKSFVKDNNFVPHVVANRLPKVEKAVHYRSWHFRELRAERFKKEQDGTNRIVFVNECIVGIDPEPYTVKLSKEQTC